MISIICYIFTNIQSKQNTQVIGSFCWCLNLKKLRKKGKKVLIFKIYLCANLWFIFLVFFLFIWCFNLGHLSSKTMQVSICSHAMGKTNNQTKQTTKKQNYFECHIQIYCFRVLIITILLVFVKNASLNFTNSGHERQRRKIVIVGTKRKAERSITASEGAI